MLTFSFGEAVDIDYVQVTFYRPYELWRGVDVSRAAQSENVPVKEGRTRLGFVLPMISKMRIL